MQDTKIEWAHHTYNPWKGCQKVSPGCDHCYAELTAAIRYKQVEWGPHAERIQTGQQIRRAPYKWNRDAVDGPRPRVFCASWADIFDNKAKPEWRAEVFQIVRETQNLDWLLLTKRPQNISQMLPAEWPSGYENVWLGTTTENQVEADRRIPILSAIPAVVRFLSVEPMLSPVVPNLNNIDWVICGGESGPGKRPLELQWARDLRDYCKSKSVAFFMKQIDGRQEIPPDLMVREFPTPRSRVSVVSPPSVDAAHDGTKGFWFEKAIHEGDTLIRCLF